VDRVSEPDDPERIAKLACDRGLSVAVAESLTGGILTSRLAAASDASAWLRGGVVAYATEVKRNVLQVTARQVVSAECARQLAEGVARLLGADIAVATTGVGGPDPQEGQPPGTVWLGVSVGGVSDAVQLHLDGEPDEVCSRAAGAALALLYRRMQDI
jgi:nicotinamide-nucleotide amidase